jgi:hypothetical protein
MTGLSALLQPPPPFPLLLPTMSKLPKPEAAGVDHSDPDSNLPNGRQMFHMSEPINYLTNKQRAMKIRYLP